MSRLGDIVQSLFQRNKIIFSPKNKNGDNDSSNAKVANNMVNNETHIHIDNTKQFEELYETVINKDSTVEFREKILPIETLISEGKPLLAIRNYEALIISYDFSNYSRDEKFLIYNGLLNCFINIDVDDKIIERWTLKIDALGDNIVEIHRYYFLLSIWKYKKKELNKAIILNNQAIKAKPDYINALAGNILLKATNKEISYDEAKKQFDEMFKNPDLKIKDNAAIYGSLGDVAFNYKDFLYAKKCYIKSNEYSKGLAKEIGIAICEYFESVNDMKEDCTEEDCTVSLENIDYTKLKKAEVIFEAIYSNRTEETIVTISRLMFPFLFNILSISNKQKRTLEIISESKLYIDYKKTDILKYIVEAEVLNGIYNIENFNNLSDYEKVKYKSFYFETTKDYKLAIELLLPILENDFQDDKMLQLLLLNALKEDNQFERYIHYYKKFIKDKNNDEVFWMNYIQFLDKSEKKDKAISEMKELEKIAKNSLVLYDLFILYLNYNLTDELDEFFEKIDSWDFRIVGLQMPFVLYNRLMHRLKSENYEKFFTEYETSNLEILSPIYKAILEVNYYTFKGDLDKAAKAYFELFKTNQNHNDLIRAVDLKINSNSLYDAEMYLEHVNPMLLDKPELFYIYYAIILKEKGKLSDAFEKIHEIKDFVIDLDSPFHQFYTAFCMNNGRIDDGIKYMAEYYAKNPNSNWFKMIQYSENETGEEIIKKIESVVGGKRDTSEINYFFNQGLIGISVYNKLLGTSIEEMLFYNHYPFTNVSIANGDVQKALFETDKIKDKIIVDTATLTILSEVKALSLLECFNEVIIPYNTITLIKQKETGIMRSSSKNILSYINSSMNIKRVPVEVGLKIKGNPSELLPEDTLDCMALSEKLEIPFLNTEVSIYAEFNPNYTVDVNSFFLYLKANKPEKREKVAEVIGNLRGFKTEFISFDADDICINYSLKGLEGIKPFLRMGKNADYKTFVTVYISALLQLEPELAEEEFKTLASEFIKFIDAYLGKTRYYMSSIIRDYPEVKNDFEKLIQRCSIKEILSVNRAFRINGFSIQAYLNILDSYDFTKIIAIMASFVSFVIQFLVRFGKTSEKFEYYVRFLKGNLRINSDADIDYIVEMFSEHLKGLRDSQS